MTDSKTNTKLDRPSHLITHKSLRELVSDLRKAEVWLFMAALAAFLASAFFVVKYFVGGDMTPSAWSGEQWANALMGLGITAVITAAQAFLYASGYKGPAAIAATTIVVFFGLFSEVSQSMEREDATVRHRSENSAVFQAALGSISSITSSANTISAEQKGLADAQAQWQYWQNQKLERRNGRGNNRYSSSTVERNLARYQQQVESFSQQAHMQGSNRAALLGGAIAQAKALEYDEDKHYAMIRLIKGIFGVTGVWASFMFSIIIIGTFEYAFHFVGTYVADHKRALRLLGRDKFGEPMHDLMNPLPEGSSPREAGIPKDYGNSLREDYLKWVTPEHLKDEVVNLKKNPEIATETVVNKVVLTKPEFTDKAQEEMAKETNTSTANVRDMTRDRFFQLIYAELRNRVVNGELKPTVRPVTDAVTEVIKHHTQALGLQPALIGKPERQKIAEKVLQKLAHELIIEPNDDPGVGKPKYRLSERWVSKSMREVPVDG